MNQIIKALKAMEAEAGTASQWKLEELCKMAALEIEIKTATNDRQTLMIYAKDRQIAELTRMLFALGKQDGQTIRTQAAEIAQLTEKVRYAMLTSRLKHWSV